MLKEDLSKIKSDYELFNVILFNNSLPRSNEIDFILHNLTFAAGYSRWRDKPSKTGNMHEIAFCKYMKFTDREIREVLIHEMIHLWQARHVAEWRYKRCTNNIAHDRVFTTKMNTINLILQRKGFDLRINTVYDAKTHLDERVQSLKEYYIIYLEDFSGKHVCFKTSSKGYSKIVKKLIDDNKAEDTKYYKNVYSIKSKSYKYNLLKCEKNIPTFVSSANDMETGEDMYLLNIKNANWIIKDEIGFID